MLLATKSVDILMLKRHSGWKSTAVAESYVEASSQNILKFAEKIYIILFLFWVEKTVIFEKAICLKKKTAF